MRAIKINIALAVIVLFCGIARGEDVDVRALQAQLAAQQAQLDDLYAKMERDRAMVDSDGKSAENMTSLRKNAAVTIGGTVNTRYYYRQGEVKSKLLPVGDPPISVPTAARAAREDFKTGDLTVSDAKVAMKIDVNDCFDAYLLMNLQDGTSQSNVSGIAENYWIRWKNIANSGFGLLVGRDALKFGDAQPIGILDNWNKDSGSTTASVFGGSRYATVDNQGGGIFAYGSMLPAHTAYNWSRTTQLNPYWESGDGSLRADVTLIQSIDRINGLTPVGERAGTKTKYRSINYGLGSAAARIQWKPISGLKLTASAMNLYAKKLDRTTTWGPTGNYGIANYGARVANSNSSVNLAVQYRPYFLSRVNAWAQWTHGWNEAWVRDMDSDSFNYGVSYDLTERWTLFAQGDYLRVKNAQNDIWNKATGWAFYTGAVFILPYGVNMEAGWRHEQLTYKGRGGLGRHTKLTGDTLYMHLGFDF